MELKNIAKLASIETNIEPYMNFRKEYLVDGNMSDSSGFWANGAEQELDLSFKFRKKYYIKQLALYNMCQGDYRAYEINIYSDINKKELIQSIKLPRNKDPFYVNFNTLTDTVIVSILNNYKGSGWSNGLSEVEILSSISSFCVESADDLFPLNNDNYVKDYAIPEKNITKVFNNYNDLAFLFKDGNKINNILKSSKSGKFKIMLRRSV